MKTKIILAIFCAVNLFSNAQTIIDPIYNRDDLRLRTPVPYAPLREADVMWAKRVWRVIDLSEKMNLPLKYPLSESTTDRRSLMDVLMGAIKDGNLTAYGFEDDEFTMPITLEQIYARGGAKQDTIEMVDSVPPYNPIYVAINRPFNADRVIAFSIKEEWFFDKQRSEMDVRIIGIAPLIYAMDEDGNVREGNYKIPLFWIYYPDARDYLVNADAFNRQNAVKTTTFDDVFQFRFFSSYIIKESNVYDRQIREYREGLSALLEAEKIKNEIVSYEHDMWEE